ncbi:helix-turn-helix domain-containing protein [Streptomyces sp. NPDC057509]|uniref:helix-turn-helix domain-containing protein n=1 Tax=Streptomyces sp. NPDC057509 TaxID=3346152 RepID=UPI003676B741
MPPSDSVQRARRDLGARLRALRTSKGLTGETLGAACGWSSSKVSRIETGFSGINAAGIKVWTAACGQPEAAPELIAIAEGIQHMYLEWREMERDGLARAQEHVLPLWDDTERFKAYAIDYIPGPLQTEDYTRAVLEGIRIRRGLSGDDLDQAVRTRAAKQQYFKKATFRIVLEEDVLYTRYAEPAVMRDQLARLIQIADYSKVSLGIIPRTADRGPAHKAQDFWIFDDRTVQVEIVSAFLTLTQGHEVRRYVDDFQRLSKLAGASVPLILDAIAAYS